MPHYPFTAIVGADDMALALVLTTVGPDIGGVLVRGEKGTAKSTMVRALTEVLPRQEVVSGCRFSCDPRHPDAACPDGPHPHAAPTTTRPARLAELPVGATEDRVTGSLDLSRALGGGETAFEPGLLANAHRGILYVDEVNLLHDHLVDLLLDAAAMGRNTVERDGVSVSHAARIVLVGTMNPEEGELRPQLLDRFGLTAEVSASRDPGERVEVVRRRLAFDADPEGFCERYAAPQSVLRERIRAAQETLPLVRLSEWALTKIATVCAGLEVDGMRADLVTARAARAHAAWEGRTDVTREDIRVAARLALPHRRRRNPFDAPGLDDELLDALLGDDEPEPEPEPDGPPPGGAEPDGDTDGSAGDAHTPPPAASGPGPTEGREPTDPPSEPGPAENPGQESEPASTPASTSAPATVASSDAPFRARRLEVRGIGAGRAGRRSRAITSWGRTVDATTARTGRVHLPATIAAAAPHQAQRGRTDRVVLQPDDLRHRVTQGREANLVLLAVDASGSMGAQQRMSAVKTAVLSLLVDAYQRRDRVGVVTFRGEGASLVLPPTSSVEAAARCLTALPHGGRTPLAEGLRTAARVLEVERIRDARLRPLLVLVTDGRATSGADALKRARWVADRWRATGVDAVVVDCEAGRFRLGLAADIAHRMGADHIPLSDVAAASLVTIIRERKAA